MGLHPGAPAHDWHSGDLITVTEIRHIHTVAMGPVWDVAPHPDADPSETPGSFRRHDIHPFGGGMTPPAWTDVPSQLESWVRDATELAAHRRPAPCPARELPLPWPGCTALRTIHPFLDGNGRVGRLAAEPLLVRLGWPRRSSTNGPGTGTSTPWTAPTTATTVRSPNSSPDPSWRTCNDSSSPTSPDQPAWSPCSPWPARPSATPRSGKRPPEVGSRPKSDPTARGAPTNDAVDTYLANRHQRRPHSAPTA